MSAGRRLRSRSGIALLITLLTLVLIVTIVFEIFRVSMRSAQSSAFARDSIRASLLAEAGTQAAIIALREDARNNSFDTLDEIWSRASPPIDLGPGLVTVTIVDQERKINLNDLIGPKGTVGAQDKQVAVFRKLLENLALDPTIADSIVDWLDADDSTRAGGAESSYYQSLKNPYKAKNDLFDTVEELRLVRGVTPEVYRKLEPFVCVSAQGSRINLNTAPKEILMSLSADEDERNGGTLDAVMADRLIQYRRDTPFRLGDPSSLKADTEKASPALGNLFRSTQITALLDVRSSTFLVRSEGEVNGIRRTFEAIGTRTGNAIQWRYLRLE
ncbi:MAG TPA: type II secretion system minor pseudopilin GspK [Candidatus Deferrimicrobiaceae bacterium]|jgi:general secretion pathway protein K